MREIRTAMRVLWGEVGEDPRDWTDVLTEDYDARPGWTDLGASKSGLRLDEGFGEVSFAEIRKNHYWTIRLLGEQEISLVFLWIWKDDEIEGMLFDGVSRIRLVNNPKHPWYGECATLPMRFHFQEQYNLASCAKVPPEKVYA